MNTVQSWYALICRCQAVFPVEQYRDVALGQDLYSVHLVLTGEKLFNAFILYDVTLRVTCRKEL